MGCPPEGLPEIDLSSKVLSTEIFLEKSKKAAHSKREQFITFCLYFFRFLEKEALCYYFCHLNLFRSGPLEGIPLSSRPSGGHPDFWSGPLEGIPLFGQALWRASRFLRLSGKSNSKVILSREIQKSNSKN